MEKHLKLKLLVDNHIYLHNYCNLSPRYTDVYTHLTTVEPQSSLSLGKWGKCNSDKTPLLIMEIARVHWFCCKLLYILPVFLYVWNWLHPSFDRIFILTFVAVPLQCIQKKSIPLMILYPSWCTLSGSVTVAADKVILNQSYLTRF